MPGVTRFDQPAQAQFLNTYVPIPFQEILQAGQGRQQRYDINRQNFEQMAAQAEELRAMPGADSAYIEGTVIPTMQEIADEYATQDYGDAEVVRDINRRIRQDIDRRLVGNIQQSYGSYQNYIQGLSELRAKGTPMPAGLIPDFSAYDTSVSGVFSGTPEAGLDFRKATKEFFDDVEPEFLGTQGIAPGRAGLVHGVTMDRLAAHAENNAAVWVETPAGNQKVRELRARGAEGTDTEIALSFLLREAPEFVQSKVSNVFEVEDDSQRSGFDRATPFTLRTQQTSLANKSYKDLQEASINYERERKDLEAQADLAARNGQDALAESINNRITHLDKENQDVNYWVNRINNKVLNQFTDSILDNVDNFKSNIADVVTDSKAREKWAQAYSKAMNENIEREGFDIANLTAEVNKAYVDLYGQDEDYTKWSQGKGYRTSKLGQNINKSLRKAKKLNEGIDDLRKKEWEAQRAEGVMEQTTLLPRVENAADFKKYPSMRELQNVIKNTSEDFMVDIVASSGVTSNKKAHLIEYLNKAETIDLISANESDPDGAYIYVVASRQDNTTGKTKSEVGYKVRLAPGQEKVVVDAYMEDGKLYDAVRWMQPSISQGIEEEFATGKEPTSVVVTIPDGIRQTAHNIEYRYIDGSWYTIQNGVPVGKPIADDKEAIKKDAYEIYADVNEIQ